MPSRREAMMGALVGSVAAVAGSVSARAAATTQARWSAGLEGQRRADLGNGHYLNPVLSGDYPDPSILKDGDDYYMTHSSFDASPGLLIWHSRDLVNWSPMGPALDKPLGTVFAVDLVKHEGRYYIYIPFMKAPWSKGLKSFANIYVIHADTMTGPWSAPIDLGIGNLIDPGHLVGEDGERYLFLSGVNRVRLTRDGLATAGPVEKVYDGWHYPDNWVTEAYALEGPKLMRRGEWFYLISAVGGTGGPATGHMVIVARS
ncbi:MAG: family 43 glycosylhydrolase, partial [bacterium]|nr:family 43 glycosylhydrolase [bacterium]